MTINRWDYKVLGKFNDIFYKDLLQKKHVCESEKFVKTVNTPDNPEKNEMEVNNFFFVLQKGHKKYLLLSEYINELPIFVKSVERVGYKGEGYDMIKSFDTARFKPEKHYTFRQLIDNFAMIRHENEKQLKLWKIICFAAYLDRINIRVSTQPGFGKDSMMDLLNDLVSGIAVVQKPTIAKLEYLSLNKILMVNELMNLSSQEYRDIEQYLLSVGAFKNGYTKRSRAGSEGREEYDISKLSLCLSYNDVNCYPNREEYFDKVQTNQIKERFLPFRFNGTITEKFLDIAEPEQIANENKSFFIKFARSIRFFEEHWREELKAYSEVTFSLTGRWKRNFETIARFVNLYADTEEEYKDLLHELYSCHLDYLTMVSEGTGLQKFEIKHFSSEEDAKKFDQQLEYEEISIDEFKDTTK